MGFAPGSMTFVNAQGQQQKVKFAKPGDKTVILKPAKGPPYAVSATALAIEVTGQLAPAQIRPGFTVVFNCTLDAKGTGVRPVESIKVLDARADGAGIQSDGQPTDGGQPVFVKGVVKGIKKGELTVAVPKHDLAPKGSITVTVADSAGVWFESRNPQRAAAGSEVKVTGIQVGAGGDVLADTILIKLPTPPGVTPKDSPFAPADKPGGKGNENPQPSPDGKPNEGEAKPDAPKDGKPGEVLPL